MLLQLFMVKLNWFGCCNTQISPFAGLIKEFWFQFWKKFILFSLMCIYLNMCLLIFIRKSTVCRKRKKRSSRAVKAWREINWGQRDSWRIHLLRYTHIYIYRQREQYSFPNSAVGLIYLDFFFFPSTGQFEMLGYHASMSKIESAHLMILPWVFITSMWNPCRGPKVGQEINLLFYEFLYRGIPWQNMWLQNNRKKYTSDLTNTVEMCNEQWIMWV